MALPFDVWIDTELRVLHSKQECPGAKVPSKYGYLKRMRVGTIEQARELDSAYRACDRCQKEYAAKKDPTTRRQFRYRRTP